MAKKEEKKDLIGLAVKLLGLGPRIVKRVAKNVSDTCDNVIEILEYFE